MVVGTKTVGQQDLFKTINLCLRIFAFKVRFYFNFNYLGIYSCIALVS